MINSDPTDHRLLRRITLERLLSFGPEPMVLEMENLNVLIGPNASGKSNLIEAIALMRATPASILSSNNLKGIVQRGGGGAADWVWKRDTSRAVWVDILVQFGEQQLRHALSFSADGNRFRLVDERIGYEPGSETPTFYYGNGKPTLFGKGDSAERTAPETFNVEISVLAQRYDPERYPGFVFLADVYERIRIYRDSGFGRQSVLRERQAADLRNDSLEENFSNLGLVLSRLLKTPKVKSAILDGLKDLYDGVTDIQVYTEGNTVQVFFTERDFSVPATRLSDGTLRYLCLLAILCDPSPPPLICIEEPELGLHPDILPKLADLIVLASERTQLIVTTHSDILIDAMSERPEVVVVCEKHEGKTKMRRLNKDDLAEWLTNYRLGQLWTRGQIGGTRW